MIDAESTTVPELIKALNDVSKELKAKGIDPSKVKVFVSSDEEGNKFGTINKDKSFGYDEEENSLSIYPYEELIPN
jgi:hypothetical protein